MLHHSEMLMLLMLFVTRRRVGLDSRRWLPVPLFHKVSLVRRQEARLDVACARIGSFGTASE